MAALKPGELQFIPYHELTAATDDWSPSQRLGQGGFGEVFEGRLRGTPVAVKRSTFPEAQRAQALASFQAEANSMLKCRHPNLLPLLGACIEHGAPLCLVFPYMAGGSLYGRLFPQLMGAAGLRASLCPPGSVSAAEAPLTAAERLDVLILVGRALKHLHGLPARVVHRDVKSLNILLDPQRGAGQSP